MKQITKYVSDDGVEFASQKNAKAYDLILKKVKLIMVNLVPIPDDINFQNGHGFVKQDASKVKASRSKLLKLGYEVFPGTEKDKVPFSFIGRYFDDSGYNCLYSAWTRLSSIDDQSREWGQPYYAINPNEGEQKEFVKTA